MAERLAGNCYSYLVRHLCVSLFFPLPPAPSPSPAISPFLNRISSPRSVAVCVGRPVSLSPSRRVIRVPSHSSSCRESKRRRTRDQLRGSAQRRRRSSWRKARKEGRKEGGILRHRQITSRNNRPLMRVSPGGRRGRGGRGGSSVEDGKVAVESEEGENNEEELKWTRSAGAVDDEGDFIAHSSTAQIERRSDRSFVAANTALHCNAAAAVSDCKWRV